MEEEKVEATDLLEIDEGDQDKRFEEERPANNTDENILINSPGSEDHPSSNQEE